MSGLDNGYIHEFPYIRIDSFSQTLTPGFPAAQLYLLTHAHTDHLTGLDNASTNIHIICSEVTKRLVLNYEREKDRIAFDKGTIERRKQAYEGLNARVAQFHQTTVSTGEKRKEDRLLTRDPFHVIPFDKPEPFEVGYDPVTGRKKWVVITMLDANHCPGSAMFLLTDPDKDLTVLHTGDIRLDRPFLDRLERRPALMPYLARFMGMDILQQDTRVDKKESGAAGQGGTFKNKILERIYLDTSAVIGTCDMPSKEEAVRGLIQAMQMYPSDTLFYIYTWTTGYEEALKAIALTFGSKIHVDRWRYLNYQNVIDDPLLQMLCTKDEQSTRFHSCERHDQCAEIQAAFTHVSRKRVVSIEFVEEKAVEHAVKMQEVHKECLLAMQGKGNWPSKLFCPLARHATLPELQALLDLFRPKAMSPNTLLPFLKGADYYAMIAAFGDCLALGGKEELRAKCLRWFRREKGLVNEAEVWNFARDMLLFQGAEGSSGGGNAEMDLRAGRSANRQRQSEAFLPTLPFATKSTLNSPKADTIPRGPTIAISPSKLTRNVEHVPVFGKTDVHGYIEEYLVAQENLMEEDDQDTQVQKSREMRSERSAKSVLAERGRDNRRSEENRKTDLSDNEPQRKRYIVYPAPANLGGIVKHAMGDPTNPKPDIQTPVSMGDGVHRHSSGVILTSRSARSSSRILLGPKINTNRAKSKDNIRLLLRKGLNP